MTTTTAAPAVLTCSVCGAECHTTRDGKCIECCSCEESMALRAENEGLAVEVKQYRLGNQKLRELARELVAWISTPIPLADYLAQTEDNRLALLARCAALGVEVGR